MVRQIIYTEYQPAFTKVPIVIVSDNISTPLNVGSVFRIADTFGVTEVILCDKSPTPPHKLISRTARGGERHVPFRYFEKTIADYLTFEFNMVMQGREYLFENNL